MKKREFFFLVVVICALSAGHSLHAAKELKLAARYNYSPDGQLQSVITSVSDTGAVGAVLSSTTYNLPLPLGEGKGEGIMSQHYFYAINPTPCTLYPKPFFHFSLFAFNFQLFPVHYFYYGNVIAATDSSSAITAKLAYSPFGEQLSGPNLPFTFSTKAVDASELAYCCENDQITDKTKLWKCYVEMFGLKFIPIDLRIRIPGIGKIRNHLIVHVEYVCNDTDPTGKKGKQTKGGSYMGRSRILGGCFQ